MTHLTSSAGPTPALQRLRGLRFGGSEADAIWRRPVAWAEATAPAQSTWASGTRALQTSCSATSKWYLWRWGPTRSDCPGTFSRVRSWTTDFGVEAGIADAQDVLPEFLEALHCGLRVERGSKRLSELGLLQLMQRSQC